MSDVGHGDHPDNDPSTGASTTKNVAGIVTPSERLAPDESGIQEHHAADRGTNKSKTSNSPEHGDVETSRESTTPPPPLPPRPARAPSPTPSLRLSKRSMRPQLLSKATTALTLADANQTAHAEGSLRIPSTASHAVSRVHSISNFHRRASCSGSETEESASVRSYVPGQNGLGEDESLLGAFASPVRDDHHRKSTSKEHFQDDQFFETIQEEDMQLEQLFKHEFDDLESLAQDGSNEESLMIRWRLKLKHFMILSTAGKPIYSRHGDDQLISNSIGVIQTILSIFINDKDSLKSFTAGDTRFVVVTKGYLFLVAISRLGETDAQLQAQLDALYMQILSTLTLPKMERLFLNRPSTDLRRPLEGTETLLSALADGFTRGSPSTLLSALESLKLRKTTRDTINKTFGKCKSPNLLYGLIVAGRRLVSVIRPRKHSLHPGDLQLIFNMLFEAAGVRAGGGENWIPLCLPGFNNTGYLYMYVNFLLASRNIDEFNDQRALAEDEEDEIAIILISAKQDGFEELRKMQHDLVKQLEANGALPAIRQAVRKGRLLCTEISPGTVIRHFLYKSRANVQFTMPAPGPAFTSPLPWRKLMTLYASLHSAVHGKNAHLKIHIVTSRTYIALAWVTPLFEFYCVANITASRNALAQGAHKIVEWAKIEEQRLFVIGGAVSHYPSIIHWATY